MPIVTVQVQVYFLDYFDEWTGGDQPDLVPAWEHEGSETFQVEIPAQGCTALELKNMVMQKAVGKEWANYGSKEVD